MPVEIDGKTYYRTVDVCLKVGISRSTLLRWLRKGVLKRSYRDRKGWRMFTEDDVSEIQAEATRIQIGERP